MSDRRDSSQTREGESTQSLAIAGRIVITAQGWGYVARTETTRDSVITRITA